MNRPARTPGDRPRPRPLLGRVSSTQRLSTSMVRVVLSGPGLGAFAPSPAADSYVKLVFQHPETDFVRDLDLEAARERLPAEHWPRLRTYTVRAVDTDDAGHPALSIDVVVHGDEGLAGPWAARAAVGDELHLLGPGGDWSPDPLADWHLLVADESALPAVAVALERLPAGAAAVVLVEVAGPADEIELTVGPRTRVTWLHRGDRPVGQALVEAVLALGVPAGRGAAFVHGEAGLVKALRRVLRQDWALPRERLSISGYWRVGADDEGWRAVKADWNRQVESEEAAAGLL